MFYFVFIEERYELCRHYLSKHVKDPILKLHSITRGTSPLDMSVRQNRPWTQRVPWTLGFWTRGPITRDSVNGTQKAMTKPSESVWHVKLIEI